MTDEKQINNIIEDIRLTYITDFFKSIDVEKYYYAKKVYYVVIFKIDLKYKCHKNDIELWMRHLEAEDFDVQVIKGHLFIRLYINN